MKCKTRGWKQALRFDLRFPAGPELSEPLIGSCNSALIWLGQSMRCRLTSCDCAAIRREAKNPIVSSVPGNIQSMPPLQDKRCSAAIESSSDSRLLSHRLISAPVLTGWAQKACSEDGVTLQLKSKQKDYWNKDVSYSATLGSTQMLLLCKFCRVFWAAHKEFSST